MGFACFGDFVSFCSFWPFRSLRWFRSFCFGFEYNLPIRHSVSVPKQLNTMTIRHVTITFSKCKATFIPVSNLVTTILQIEVLMWSFFYSVGRLVSSGKPSREYLSLLTRHSIEILTVQHLRFYGEGKAFSEYKA